MGIIFSGGQKAGEAGAMENKRKAIASWTMRVAVMSAGVSAAVPACGVCECVCVHRSAREEMARLGE